MKTKPKIIVLTGYGLNCEEETALAFDLALRQSSGSSSSQFHSKASTGSKVDIVHINDLIDNPSRLNKYQILAIPGGFSYGDDLGSGRAYANKINNHLKKYITEFAEKDKLIIGICNGFQILTNIGLLPGVLTFNDNNRYTDRWVDVRIKSASPWLKGIESLSLPIAHGEGKYIINDAELSQDQIAGVYYKGKICSYQSLAANPNGSMLNIAMLTSENGKILGTMPHPERGMFFTNLPNWPVLKEKLLRSGKKLPEFGPSLQIFKNAINYFK